MRSARLQQGLAAAALLIIVILALLAVVLGRGAFRDEEAGLDQRGVTDARMKKITDALVAFVVLNTRLPCPASGTLDTGEAAPDTATTACTAPDGVVPWKSLALRREDAADGWGRQISYRVFGGVTGFTQAGGVNMTNCNSSLGFPLDLTLESNIFCKTGAPPPNMPLQYFGIRGNMLVVEDAGATRNGNAFVLVSHGDTGYGAFAADGATGRTVLPNNAGREFTNTQATGTTWILPRSAPGTPASDAAHFDDIVAYLGASELVSRAKLAARAWSEFPLATQFNAPAVEAAKPGFDHTVSEDTLSTVLAVGGYLVIASTSNPGTVNVGFSEQDSIGGIGVFGNGSTSGDLNSDFGERLTFQLGSGSAFQKTSLALNRFKMFSASPLEAEVAEISFWRGGDLLQASVVTSWTEEDRPTRCLFGLVSGAVFDRVDVRPLARFGAVGNSRFSVAAIKSCSEATGSCTVDVADATANSITIEDCPSRPPSASSTAAQAITATTATLNGAVHPNGVNTTVSFDYGTTCSYPSNAAAAPGSLNAGDGNTPVTASLAGLACNTSYYFRTNAVSAGGTTTGNDALFTTAACAFPTPGATTSPPTGVDFDATDGARATLNGVVNDNGDDTTVTFDFGTTSCYGASVPAAPATVTAGTGAAAVVSSPLRLTTLANGLLCNTRYHYRTRAVSAAGTATGNDVSFMTAPCP